MKKKSVISHNQKGGITAYNVSLDKELTEDSRTRLPSWIKWIVAIASIVGAIAAVLALI